VKRRVEAERYWFQKIEVNFERVGSVVRTHQPNAVLLYDYETLCWQRLALQAELVTHDERIRLRRTAAET
jgi:hypothetical protein